MGLISSLDLCHRKGMRSNEIDSGLGRMKIITSEVSAVNKLTIIMSLKS